MKKQKSQAPYIKEIIDFNLGESNRGNAANFFLKINNIDNPDDLEQWTQGNSSVLTTLYTTEMIWTSLFRLKKCL